MRTTNRALMNAAASVALALGSFVPASGQAVDPDGYGDGYRSGAFGRVRAAEGGASIVHADDAHGEPDQAGVNAPIFPGDTVRTEGGQRVEVQLASGTIVRLDRSGEIVFQSLPDPSAKYQDNTVLALNAGVMRVTTRLGDKDEFRIDTRSASVYLLGEGEFRIETDDRSGTRVASLRGVAEVVGNDASVLVRGGMRTAVIGGLAPETPRSYSAFTADGFDRWCLARDDAYRGHDRDVAHDDRRDEVPEEVRPYYSELSSNGRWTVVPEFGTVWYPTGVATGWRPYDDGYWTYGPGGYFWVSYEPWGWAPYHYGNWQWVPYHGWCWVPGHVFAGAWVSWSWGSLYVGWAPLDYWGRPGWIGGPYYAGYYDPGCWRFVNYDHLDARHVQRYAVPIGTVRDDLREATVVARAPSVDPRRIARSPVARERALRMVAEDRSARMRPIQADRLPERKLSDVQDHLMRRPAQESPAVHAPRSTIATPIFDRRTTVERPRRILDDPRVGSRSPARPETQNDVRELYQRMSRPRETRGQDASPPPETRSLRTRPQQQAPPAARVESPRARPRAEAPGADAPTARTPSADAPAARAPRAKTPPSEAPQAKASQERAPRAQAPRAPSSRGKPKPKDKR